MKTDCGPKSKFKMQSQKAGLPKQNTTKLSTETTIDNICHKCRVLTGRKPCDKPCKDFNNLLEKELKGETL